MNMKKYLAVAVILLFIGLAFAPTIHANISKASIDNDLVEFTTEICGLNGGKHTVQLTKTQAEEVEQLFDSIRERLNATETREEAEEIFKEAVVELDKYGLLGGLSVKQAQRLVTGGYQNQGFSRLLKRLYKADFPFNNEIYEKEFLCLIAGHSNLTLFVGPIASLLATIWFSLLFIEVTFPSVRSLIEPLFHFIGFLISLNTNYNPLVFANFMVMGFYIFLLSYGWIITTGLSGINSRNGYFSGRVWFFTGIKINLGEFEFFYIGFAPIVELLLIPPEIK